MEPPSRPTEAPASGYGNPFSWFQTTSGEPEAPAVSGLMETTTHSRHDPPVAPDDDDAKRTVLLDLHQLKSRHGISFTKEWSMDDRLEDMLLELRRHSLAIDEKNNVNMMRDGMRLLVTGVEMVNNRLGVLDLEGWSAEACRDLSQHDADLARIYRRYWRRGTASSPEMTIALSFLGSMGMHHVRRTMSRTFMNQSRPRRQGRAAPVEEDSSDEEAP